MLEQAAGHNTINNSCIQLQLTWSRSDIYLGSLLNSVLPTKQVVCLFFSIMLLLPTQNIPEVPTYSFALLLLSTATSAKVLKAISLLADITAIFFLWHYQESQTVGSEELEVVEILITQRSENNPPFMEANEKQNLTRNKVQKMWARCAQILFCTPFTFFGASEGLLGPFFHANLSPQLA